MSRDTAGSVVEPITEMGDPDPASLDGVTRRRPYIYFIGPDRRGAPVKIGRKPGWSPWKTFLSQLQRGNPERLFILNVYEGVEYEPDTHFEGGVHELFRHARIRGEWFDPWRDVRIEHLACSRSNRTIGAIWQTLYGELRTADELPRRVTRTQGDCFLRDTAYPSQRHVDPKGLEAMYRAQLETPRLRLVRRAGPKCNWYRSTPSSA